MPMIDRLPHPPAALTLDLQHDSWHCARHCLLPDRLEASPSSFGTFVHVRKRYFSGSSSSIPIFPVCQQSFCQHFSRRIAAQQSAQPALEQIACVQQPRWSSALTPLEKAALACIGLFAQQPPWSMTAALGHDITHVAQHLLTDTACRPGVFDFTLKHPALESEERTSR